MALIIVAVTGSHKEGSGSSNKTLLTVACVLMALAWSLMLIWALWSLGKSKASSSSKRIPSFHGGRVVSHDKSIQSTLLVTNSSKAIIRSLHSTPTSCTAPWIRDCIPSD
jgi:hypothetical protein